MTKRSPSFAPRLFLELLEDRALPGSVLPTALAAPSPAQSAETSGQFAQPLLMAEAAVTPADFLGWTNQSVRVNPTGRAFRAAMSDAQRPRQEAAPFQPDVPGTARLPHHTPPASPSPAATEHLSVMPSVGLPPVAAVGLSAPSLWNQGLAEGVASFRGGAGGQAALGTFQLSEPFSYIYTAVDLGAVPGLPTNYGGLTLLASTRDLLLIGGNANEANAAVYVVPVTRDAAGHIAGFAAPAIAMAAAPYLGGNLVYGPDELLFYPRWPSNEVGQIKPGSSVTDKVVDLTPLGVTSSVDGLEFVPPWFPGGEQLKLVSWSSGDFYTADYAPDGMGTYDITAARRVAQLPGGVTGIAYYPAGFPLFDNYSLIVAEWSNTTVATYDLDADGNPLVATRRELLTGDASFHAPYIDPYTGDILIGTWGGNNHLISVQLQGSTTPLRGTYLFNGTLNPEQPGVPPVVGVDPLGLNRFETANVYGQQRQVYRWDGNEKPTRDQAGLTLHTNGLLTPNNYSIELVFEFVEEKGSYRKILDVQDRQPDSGFYVSPSDVLNVYPEASGTTMLGTNIFNHIVLTNGSDGIVRAYLNGARELTTPVTTVMNINNPGRLVHLFLDDEATVTEYSDGRIALLRMYDSVLSDAEVAALAQAPFAYP